MTTQATIDIENDCSGAGLARAEDTAVELYQLAALMLGSETAALSLVEQIISGVDIDPCQPEEVATGLVRRHLIGAAIAEMTQTHPDAFLAPSASDEAVTCIEGDDLSAAGISQTELFTLVSGNGSGELRSWLENLAPAQRAIFVQRAVLGWDNGVTAHSLQTGSGSGWQPHQVSEVFRQALCSLTTSLVHSAAEHKVTA